MISDAEYAWRQVRTTGGLYAHSAEDHKYPDDPWAWNVLTCATDDHPLCRRNSREDDPRLVRVGGIAVGVVTARTCLESGTIVYEVEPVGPWPGMPAHPRQEITDESHGGA